MVSLVADNGIAIGGKLDVRLNDKLLNRMPQDSRGVMCVSGGQDNKLETSLSSERQLRLWHDIMAIQIGRAARQTRKLCGHQNRTPERFQNFGSPTKEYNISQTFTRLKSLG